MKRRRGLCALLALGCAFGSPAASAAGVAIGSTPEAEVAFRGLRALFAPDGDGGGTTLWMHASVKSQTNRVVWLVPLRGIIDASFSTGGILSRLDEATEPRFDRTDTVLGNCAPGSPVQARFTLPALPYEEDIGDVTEDPDAIWNVETAARGRLEVIRTGTLEGLVDVLDLLGYRLNELAGAGIAPYLGIGWNVLFIEAQLGGPEAVLPAVRVQLDSALYTIPMLAGRALADTRDSGEPVDLRVFVAGAGRAIPLVWPTVEVTEARFRWLESVRNGPQGYERALDSAMLDAAWEGFVTEAARPGTTPAEGVWNARDSRLYVNLLNINWIGREADLIAAIVDIHRGSSALLGIIGEHVPLPPEVAAGDVVRCPTCVFPLGSEVPGVDIPALLESVHNRIAVAHAEAAARIERPGFLTRLRAKVVWPLIGTDPAFVIRPPPVEEKGRTRVASREVECSLLYTADTAPWVLQTPQGDLVRGLGITQASTWSLPAARRILQERVDGDPEVLVDNRQSIENQLAVVNDAIGVRPPLDPGGCTCAAPASPAGAPVVIVGLALSALAGRRRRQVRRKGGVRSRRSGANDARPRTLSA